MPQVDWYSCQSLYPPPIYTWKRWAFPAQFFTFWIFFLSLVCQNPDLFFTFWVERTAYVSFHCCLGRLGGRWDVGITWCSSIWFYCLEMSNWRFEELKYFDQKIQFIDAFKFWEAMPHSGLAQINENECAAWCKSLSASCVRCWGKALAHQYFVPYWFLIGSCFLLKTGGPPVKLHEVCCRCQLC